jgi:hypothetical protein
MKPIRVTSEKEFERLRDRIDLETSDAADHFYLLKGLDESSEDYCLEMNESSTFWHLTFIAHRDAVLSRLCLLYDQYDGALSLGRFLLTVKANRALFSDAACRERLIGNPHVDALVHDRAIDDSELDREVASVSDADPLVAKLSRLRNKVISHTDADTVRRGTPRFWLPVQDIETLLSRARSITSKYSLLYRASTYGRMVGTDDYKATLRWLRKALSSHRAQIDKEVEQMGIGERWKRKPE